MTKTIEEVIRANVSELGCDVCYQPHTECQECFDENTVIPLAQALRKDFYLVEKEGAEEKMLGVIMEKWKEKYQQGYLELSDDDEFLVDSIAQAIIKLIGG